MNSLYFYHCISLNIIFQGGSNKTSSCNCMYICMLTHVYQCVCVHRYVMYTKMCILFMYVHVYFLCAFMSKFWWTSLNCPEVESPFLLNSNVGFFTNLMKTSNNHTIFKVLMKSPSWKKWCYTQSWLKIIFSVFYQLWPEKK